ncbi:MAG: 8-oxo-dGTP diphosphatase MutT, partial [Solobacterium sp.]|nr:8-oxo-dGTP diphosphatase MutT [Solobacterium sp.]
TTIEHDYPKFHLSMKCYWARIIEGKPVLLEHEAARWLSREELDSVAWLPADVTIIELVKQAL